MFPGSLGRVPDVPWAPAASPGQLLRLLLDGVPRTRAELASQTGLTRAAVRTRLDALQDAGFLTDRGIKRARFVVIKNISVPGILVEGGFMSGAPDYQLIATPEFRQKMAQSIVEGVNRYKEAVSGQMQYQRPSVVVSATAPTTVPNLKTTPGSKTDDKSSVAQARDALESSSAGN